MSTTDKRTLVPVLYIFTLNFFLPLFYAQPLFFTVQPSPQQKINFLYYEISGLDICSLICGEHMDLESYFFVILAANSSKKIVSCW